ncbi:LysR family transcriptional regulator [Enterobacteriaceae bacterium RIT691]|nr:LysR family transcriptional regulator [Enterobacteriaceae bacterium RIT691]
MQTEIDLKLLKIINTLVVSGSVTKTAKLLNLSPGTISYSLKKARTLTGAHLFIRTKTGMKPDTTARELSQRYHKFAGLNNDSAFTDEPLASKEITVMTYSLVEMMIAKIAQHSEIKKQSYRYTFLPYNNNVSLRLENLKNGQVDIDIGAKLPADTLISKVKLFSCPVSVLVKRDSALDTQLTLDDWRNHQHAVWSVFADYYSENILTAKSAMQHINERNIAMISASIINMVAFCASSDCMMIIPDYFAPLLTQAFPVKRLLMPPEMEIKYDCYLHFNNSLMENESALNVANAITTLLRKGLSDTYPHQ